MLTGAVPRSPAAPGTRWAQSVPALVEMLLVVAAIAALWPLFDRVAQLGAGRDQRFLDRGIAVVGLPDPSCRRPATASPRPPRRASPTRCAGRARAHRRGRRPPCRAPSPTRSCERPRHSSARCAMPRSARWRCACRPRAAAPSCASTPTRSPRSNRTSRRSGSASRSRAATTAGRCRCAAPRAGSTPRSPRGSPATPTPRPGDDGARQRRPAPRRRARRPRRHRAARRRGAAARGAVAHG